MVAGYDSRSCPPTRASSAAPDAAAIVEYIKSLRTDAPTAEPQKGPSMSSSAVAPRQVGPAFNTPNYLNAETTVRSWLTTLDHKRIGVMYLALTLIGVLPGRRLRAAPAHRAAHPGPDDHGRHDLQPHVHAARRGHDLPLHDPGHPGASSATSSCPLMIGAQDVAFPRSTCSPSTSTCSARVIALWGMIHGGTDTGWTFYTPYSTTTAPRVAAGPARRLHPRLRLDRHRPQLHRHRPHHARPGRDLDAAAALRLGASTPPASSRCWPRRCWA